MEHVDYDGEGAEGKVTQPMPNIIDDGADLQLSVLLERRKRMYNRLLKQVSLVETLLETNNVDMVNGEIANIDQLLSELIYIDGRCYELDVSEGKIHSYLLMMQMKRCLS